MSGPGFSFTTLVSSATATALPQDLGTTDTPQFGGLGIGIAGACNKLRLAAAGIIDFDSGDVTLTQSNNTLTLAGGVLVLPAGSVSANALGVGAVDTGLANVSTRLVLVHGGSAWAAVDSSVGFRALSRLTLDSVIGTGSVFLEGDDAAGLLKIGKTVAQADGCVAYTNCTNYGCGQYVEMATAPPGNCNLATVYAVDNGAGKTQLMVVFQTGSPVEIAIEP